MTAPTEPVEPVAASASRWQAVLPYTAPALVFLAVVVPFLRFHEYDLLLPESLILMGGAAIVGAAIGALGRLRPRTLAPMLTAFTLSIFVFYRQEVTDALIDAANAVAELTGHSVVVFAVLGLAFFAAIGLLCVLMKQHLDAIITAGFGAMVASMILLPTAIGGEPVETGALPQNLKDLPPVVHIVLDEHIGVAGLPAELEESAAIEDTLLATFKDFALYTHAYSYFPETQFSLGSMLNDRPGEGVTELVVAKPTGTGYVLQESAWFDRLKAEGYAIKVYQNDWLDMCREIDAVDACYLYPLYSINAVQRSELSTTARLRVLLGKLYLWRDVALPGPLAASEALARFRSDLAQSPRGVAYIVHLLLPHYGYLFNEDCSLADPSQWMDQPYDPEVTYTPADRLAAYRRYLPQVVCTVRKMEAVFDDLRRLGVYEDATIVVHGDHGSRIGEHAFRAAAGSMTERDLVDHFSTLLAVKQPRLAPGVREAPAPMQQVFAETFLGGGAAVTPAGRVWLWDEEKTALTPATFPWVAQDSGGVPSGTDLLSARPQLRPSIE